MIRVSNIDDMMIFLLFILFVFIAIIDINRMDLIFIKFINGHLNTVFFTKFFVSFVCFAVEVSFKLLMFFVRFFCFLDIGHAVFSICASIISTKIIRRINPPSLLNTFLVFFAIFIDDAHSICYSGTYFRSNIDVATLLRTDF